MAPTTTAPTTPVLKKNPGQYLQQHWDALKKIVEEQNKATLDQSIAADDFLDQDFADEEMKIAQLLAAGLSSPKKGRKRSLMGLMSSEVRGLSYLAPANALREAEELVKKTEKGNTKARLDHAKAINLKEELKNNPWTDVGAHGLAGFILRQILSAINLTPFTGLNRFEVTDKGLVLSQPFNTVSSRTITKQDLDERNVVLGVNPPAYFDLILGVLGQFRWSRDIPSPWGQLVIDEPGSGRTIGTAVVFWPTERRSDVEKMLSQLEFVETPLHQKIRDIPQLSDVLISYDVLKWQNRLLDWTKNPRKIPEEFLLPLYIPPPEKKEEKKSKPKWPKRMGCLLAVVFFFVFIVLRPVWWVLAFIWTRLGFTIPRYLRFFT